MGASDSRAIACRYHGLLAQRFALISNAYRECFEECFRRQYALIHRLETNKLRNVARFFAHLLATDAISWGVLDHIRLTEDDTTSSSRIFIKVMFQVRSPETPILPVSGAVPPWHGEFPPCANCAAQPCACAACRQAC